MATTATATRLRPQHKRRRANAVLAKGNFCCPKCKRTIETHISTRMVFCNTCKRPMKRLD